MLLAQQLGKRFAGGRRARRSFGLSCVRLGPRRSPERLCRSTVADRALRQRASLLDNMTLGRGNVDRIHQRVWRGLLKHNNHRARRNRQTVLVLQAAARSAPTAGVYHALHEHNRTGWSAPRQSAQSTASLIAQEIHAREPAVLRSTVKLQDGISAASEHPRMDRIATFLEDNTSSGIPRFL